MNMLGALAVRVHGIQDERWMTKDKITQYKGMVTLFRRDRKILEADSAVARKKQKKELKNLQKEIERQRHDLDNAIRGDRQMLRTTLQENRAMQLAYQDMHPLKVVECLHQENFNKRKQLDRLNYHMSQRTDQLIALKLEQAQLEDNKKSDDCLVLPVEKVIEIVTGQVQDAVLKREAALSVRHTYKKILNILKQDALYFDAVLNAIKIDACNQSKCMLGATQLGQLATEYLDDRIEEFNNLEKLVKRDMKERENNLQELRNRVHSVSENMRFFLRRDSDINLGRVLLEKTYSDIALKDDIEYLEGVLTVLKNSFAVPNFEALLPCILEQDRQKNRLQELLATMTEYRDTLLKKKNHAALMHSVMVNSMVETTLEYKAQKKELLTKIAEQETRKKEVDEVCMHRYKLLAMVRTALLAIWVFTLIINYDEPKGKGKGVVVQDERASKPQQAAEQDYTNALTIIEAIEKRLTKVINYIAGFELTQEQKEQAYKLFEGINRYPKSLFSREEDTEDSLLGGFVMEDPNVLSRLEIKKKSKQLYDLCSVDPDLIPDDKKKSSKKKKK
ncbi:uncharacterized protein LOC108741563 [Agrilus planipennis]|uniref:Uncharacterized protein LOC108741563 n=1 Tax=Agrilus planipennis TaxID=224129 RepID=A0A1W4X790_AGRPL|nr:uncharacterized protein LOC108741563 [Agrilus planipennis]